MTRTCGSLPGHPAHASRIGHFGATIERDESLSVASLVSLTAAVRDTGAPRSLLYARIDWAKLQGVSSQPIGALPPSTARATYSRDARHAQRQRQLARRGGVTGFLRALTAPTS